LPIGKIRPWEKVLILRRRPESSGDFITDRLKSRSKGLQTQMRGILREFHYRFVLRADVGSLPEKSITSTRPQQFSLASEARAGAGRQR
jgi:hypothetical protein